MPAESGVPYGCNTQRPPKIDEVHILWITAGLGCDGDSVSITAASQPSIEDVVLGAIPGLPKVHLHNPVLAYENGDELMQYFHQAHRGEIENFVLVVEGSIPNEKINGDGYWAAMGTDPETKQPIKTTSACLQRRRHCHLTCSIYLITITKTLLMNRIIEYRPRPRSCQMELRCNPASPANFV
jgi:hypothetical protein